MRWLLSAVTGVLIGVSVFAAGAAHAQPVPAPPPGPTQPVSTSDELADMVMDVIQHGGIRTTTPVPAPAP